MQNKKTLEEVYTPTEWLLPCNLKYYYLEEALKDLKIIDWHQTRSMNNAKVGDLVYIYVIPTKGDKASIWYKGIILEVNKFDGYIDDVKYAVYGQDDPGRCFSIAMFREYDNHGSALSYSRLVEAGLKGSIMGPRKVKGTVAEYLHMCDLKQRDLDAASNSIPDTCVKIEELPISVDEPFTDEEIDRYVGTLSRDELEHIVSKIQPKVSPAVLRSTIVRERNHYIAELAKKRANGICQLCGKPAPFLSKDGEPYLESHHIEWLSKGGLDSVENTVALCPNCHRRMHVLDSEEDVNKLKACKKTQS